MSAVLAKLLEQGVAAGTFPSAWAVVRYQGRVFFSGGAGEATASTVFDLASLTKVMATTACFVSLWSGKTLSPETQLSRFCSGPAADAGVTLADLLFHRSGLPAFEPFFAATLRAFPRLLEASCPSLLRDQARAHALASAEATPLASTLRTRAVYSDVGFIQLGEALARSSGLGLDVLFAERVAAPLGLTARFHRLSAGGATPALATGKTRPREPAPGQEGLWQKVPVAPSLPGEVDDDNAFVLDGVAGHAGLFGTASDVAAWGQQVLDGLAGKSALAPAQRWDELVRRDTATHESTRALGFDTPSTQGSSAGTLLGKRGRGAVGHTGFTGTSLWVDLDRELVVALCTNRTGGPNGRANQGIRDFRPRFHDAVIHALEEP